LYEKKFTKMEEEESNALEVAAKETQEGKEKEKNTSR
jgi:hypothetical protein